MTSLAAALVTLGFSGLSLAGVATADQGRIIIKGKSGLPQQALEKIISKHSGQKVTRIPGLGAEVIQVPAHARQQVLEQLRHHPHIEFAEVDELIAPDALPDDPRLGDQWHLDNIQAKTAWDHIKGDAITIAILDTGVDPDHPDLVNKLASGWNAVGQNNDWMDLAGHGTKVAGTAAAMTNNGTGVAGVAWNSRIMPVRVSNADNGYAYYSDIARGLTWAADNGARVANISYGVSASSTVSAAASYMRSKGGLVVVSAGNSGSELNYVENPDMISVSATASSDNITSWSSYGEFVDLAAPGLSIVTTANGGGYTASSGTSFSSPVVAGVAALVASANNALDAQQIEDLLEQTADDRGSNGWDKYYGHGRVNAYQAVLAALDQNPPGDVTAPQVSITQPIGGEVSGMVNVLVDARDDVAVNAVELYINGQWLATDVTAPYEYSWDSTSQADGSVILEARAVDTSGNQSLASVAVEVVNNPVVADTTAPSLNLLSPSDGESLSRKLEIRASASDASGIQMLACYFDRNLLATTSEGSLTCNVNLRKVTLGEHEVMVRAIDNAANESRRTAMIHVVKSPRKRGNSRNK